MRRILIGLALALLAGCGAAPFLQPGDEVRAGLTGEHADNGSLFITLTLDRQRLCRLGRGDEHSPRGHQGANQRQTKGFHSRGLFPGNRCRVGPETGSLKTGTFKEQGPIL